ncbi:MAG TPA: carbon monoxide dehydrogenase/acetyl-CoA synthase methytransferase subunit [Lachnospiraceae bacterium]|nr:carbon monoxide dehydrogenase/acetyl-CoA synthase methytransferase subunit [Lachnospiraceae bacterium]
MAKFIVVGERIHCISPSIKKALAERNPEPVLARAKAQIEAGADYLDVNIGPGGEDAEDLMKWAVTTIQGACDDIPLALDTANTKAIEAGLSVYSRKKGKPVINSADAGDRIGNIDLAAANDAIVIALCAAGSIAADNDERMAYCQTMLERGLTLGMSENDIWFDPSFVVVKGMQEKYTEILEALKLFKDMGLNSTGGISNNSNGAPKSVRPVMDATLISMAMACGLSSAICNPCDERVMQAIKTADIFLGNTLYADSYLEI